jgi:hypothetical protein
LLALSRKEAKPSSIIREALEMEPENNSAEFLSWIQTLDRSEQLECVV